MINEVALILLWGLFGIKVALLYIVSGLFVAIFGGIIIGELKLERFVEDFVYKAKGASEGCSCNSNQIPTTNKERFKEARESAWEIFKKVYLYIIIGVGIGALIHGFVPTGLLVKYAGTKPYAVSIAVIIVFHLCKYSRSFADNGSISEAGAADRNCFGIYHGGYRIVFS